MLLNKLMRRNLHYHNIVKMKRFVQVEHFRYHGLTQIPRYKNEISCDFMLIPELNSR